MLREERHSPHDGDERIDPQQKLARVQSLLEASRRVHSTIRLDDVLAGVLEIAAKELEAEGAFFSSMGAQLEARASAYGRMPDDWTRWTERAPLPGYASAPLTGERGDTLGPPLGMLPGRTYETVSFTLAEGGQLLLYTDGLTEVFRGEEEFGEERLLGLLGTKPSATLLDDVWTAPARFAENARQTDDMTALYLSPGGAQ